MRAIIAEYAMWMDASRYAASTVRSRRRDLLHFAAWCGASGVENVGAITLPMLERYREVLHRRRRRDGRPLGCGSQVLHLLAVKRFFNWAARMCLIPSDVGAQLELPRRPQHLPHTVLAVGEVERVLAQPDVRGPMGLRDRAILETLYSTGMRRLELINLALSDLSPDRGVVLIREGKGGKDRVVPIGARALVWIERYVTEGRPHPATIPAVGNVFLGRRGRPLRSNRLSELVHRYVSAARLGKTGSCHLFRHTMATLMLEHGADVRYLQAMLGHAKLTTTEIYTRVSITSLKAVHQRTHPAGLAEAAMADGGGHAHIGA